MMSLFSRKRMHYLTIGFRDADGKDQVAVFELGKRIVRPTLTILERRTGKWSNWTCEGDPAAIAAAGQPTALR